VAIILRANKDSSELGGHIASFQSSALLYDIGFGHFWHAPSEGHGGDLIYVQGHVSPGIYARAFVEGRLTEEQLLAFRQESEGKGIPSYPHPWLMPDFWQFPTVSMGTGPVDGDLSGALPQVPRGPRLAKTGNRKVWAFLGDGECDEPESLGAISLAGREGLDNLIFVINCNLQRLDGPVRGNGKIIQELEGVFRGAGWNAIKVVWGSTWDKLFAKDKAGILLKRMEECVDGQYQDFKSKDGAYVREHFFNTPELKALVADLSDEQVWHLSRGGHDPFKVYAAYAAANEHKGQPTVILAKTVKGYGMGESGEGQMISHQAKKMTQDALKQFRDRFDIPVPDDKLAELPFISLPADSPERKYLHERRAALGGYLPQRRRNSRPLSPPPLSSFERLLKSSDQREISTTMAFVQMLGTLVRDKAIGKHIVPIVPRRVEDVRDGRDVPPARHLFLRRPALQAAGRRPADVLPRGQGGPGAAGRHQRSRRDELVDRRGDVVLQQRPADDPVLHLLLDVRPAARRRSRLARRGHASARLLAGRNCGAHDAQRGRDCSTRRPQPRPGIDDPQLHFVRSHVRVRGRRSSFAKASGGCTRSSRTSTTTSR
jgi:pyruvate dehydrogenase E1 component